MAHTLRTRYELGQHVLELHRDATDNGARVYGRNSIDRISKLLRWDDGVIRLALRFVQTYSPEDVDRLCDLVLPNGEPLTWSHVRCVLAVDDVARREVLLSRTVAEGWTCTELARQVRALTGPPRPGGPGRPPRTPKDFDGAVAQQLHAAEQWDRLHTSVWNAPDRGLPAFAAKLPPEQVTDDRLHQARQVAYQLRRVADQARVQAEKAEQVVRELERLLDQQEPPGTPDVAEAATLKLTWVQPPVAEASEEPCQAEEGNLCQAENA